MTIELSPDVSNHIYYHLVDKIHPDNISKISVSDLNKDLSFLATSQKDLPLREILFESSLASLTQESSQRIIKNHSTYASISIS